MYSVVVLLEATRSCVCALLEAKTQLDLQNESGKTALILACSWGDSNMLPTVQALIQAGANLNLQDESGYTALATALVKQDEACTIALIKAHALLNLRDNNGQRALTLARSFSPRLARVLARAGARE